MHTLRSLALSGLALVAGTAAAQTPKPKSSSKLTIDELIQIKHPSNLQWTPDGSHVWFVYDDGGVNNVWAAPPLPCPTRKAPCEPPGEREQPRARSADGHATCGAPPMAETASRPPFN